MTTDPPSQSHSKTSVDSAKSMSRKRVLDQEKWIYEVLRRSPRGMADWELWDKAKIIGIVFDQKSSVHRARIGLMWVNRGSGATPWHPVENSEMTNICPDSGKSTAIWRIKEQYRDMVYEEWSKAYRNLAKGKA